MDPTAALFERFARAGDVGALGEVFDRTAPKLLHLAMHLARSAEDAEDLLQATFVLAMRKAGEFAPAQPVLPWLSGILAGEAKNLARRNSRRRTDELPELATAEGGPIASAERSELVARLRARVEDLPQEQRQALLLQLQHGLSPTDIAEVLDVPPGTVRMRLHRGLQALRRLLPSALAVWLFGAFGTRGIAAVRAAVMKEAGVARATPIAGAAAIAAGAMTMKYGFAGAAALLAAVLCWWFLAPPHDPAPVSAVANDTARAVSSDAAAGAAPAVDRVAAAAASDAVRDDTGALRVRVTSASNGRPIVDLTIRAWPGTDDRCVDGTAVVARTDGGGIARFAAIASGHWRIEPLGCTTPAGAAEVTAGAELTHEIVLPSRPLQGIVVDEHGAAVAAASIRVGESNSMQRFDGDTSRPDVSPAAYSRTAATSAADGTFACDAGTSETYVAASHPQYTSSHTQLTNAPGLRRWRLVLHARTREIRGVVLDAARKPVAGATVDARVFALPQRTTEGTWLGPILAEFATTGADGRFAFGMLPPGTTRLAASAPGHRPATAGTQKPNEDVELVLGDGCDIVGTVRDADGTPFRSGLVYVLHGPNRSWFGQAEVRNGRFRVREGPAPPFSLALYGDGSGWALLEHEVARSEGAQTRVEIVVPSRPALNGVVVDDAGRPLANWLVAASPTDAARHTAFFQRVSTDAEGRFVLRDLRQGRVRVVATWPAGDAADPAIANDDVSAFAGELVLRVPADRLPRASVTGRIVDVAGNAMPGVVLTLARQSDPSIRHLAPGSDTGVFRVERVSAGDYTLSIAAGDEQARTLRSVRVPRDAPVDLGDLRLLPQATLHVDVVRADGTPWQQALPNVWLTELDGSTREWRPQFHDGGFEGRLEPGPLRIQVSDPDLIAQAQDVELVPGERRIVRIAVAVGRSITLVFAGDRDAADRKIDPKDLVHVEILDQRGALVLRRDFGRSRHGAGNWQLDRVFAFGEYTVTAHTDSGRRYRGTFAATETMRDRSIEVPRQP